MIAAIMRGGWKCLNEDGGLATLAAAQPRRSWPFSAFKPPRRPIIPPVIATLAYIAYVLMALLGFGFVIAIHEFGHFIFAKWSGVRVDVFSIGFGPVVLHKRYGETDYQLALLPLGGYVKMLGQEDVPSGQEQPAAPDPRSYLSKSAGWRALILLGGVLFNLISSYAILLGLVAWGMPVFRPIVGDVAPVVVDQRGLPVESPAAKLGLRRGDRLIEVDGETVRSFDDVMTAVIFAGGRPLNLVVERGPDKQVVRLPEPGAAPVEPIFDGRFGRPSLGIEFPASNRVLLTFDAPPDGLRRFDRIVAVAGEDVSGLIGQDLQERLACHLGKAVPVSILRDGKRLDLTLTYAGEDTSFEVRAGVPTAIGALPEGSAAAAAGLRVGDWLSDVDGVPVAGYGHFLALVRSGITAKGACRIGVQRDGTRVEALVTATESFGVKRVGIVPRSVHRGVLTVLPPALDGGPSLLARTGLKPGDALVSWESGESAVDIAWVSGGTAVLLPLGLDAKAWQQENRFHDIGLLRKILRQSAAPGLAELLTGTRVEEVRDTAIVLKPLSGEARVVGRDRFGPAAASLQVGDWLADARMGGDGAVLEVVRGAGAAQRATLNPPPLGTTVVLFEREELPYETKGFADSIALVNDAAYNLVVKSVLLLPRLFRSPEAGGVDANKSLTGPIGIFRVLKERAELMGFDSFLKLVAMVGLNLFIVNLLPIPITDGGQLLMLGIETAIRRPLPMWLRNGLMYLGIGLVGALFIYICGLDILRLFGVA